MDHVLKLFGAFERRDPRELARSLMLSVGVPVMAIVLFLALWAAYQMGWIEPKQGPVNWHQNEQPAAQPANPE